MFFKKMPRRYKRIVPCLVLDNEGKTRVELEGTGGAWRCTNWKCELRGRGEGTAYDDPGVRLKTRRRGNIHGVMDCKGVGK